MRSNPCESQQGRHIEVPLFVAVSCVEIKGEGKMIPSNNPPHSCLCGRVVSENQRMWLITASVGCIPAGLPRQHTVTAMNAKKKRVMVSDVSDAKGFKFKN